MPADDSRALREENHKLTLALRSVELTLDKLLTENKILSMNASKKCAEIGELRLSTAELEKKVCDERNKSSLAAVAHRLELDALRLALDERKAEANALSLRLEARSASNLSKNTNNNNNNINNGNKLQDQSALLAEQNARLKERLEILERQLAREKCEVEELSTKFRSSAARQQAVAREAKERAAQELTEAKKACEKAESEREALRSSFCERELQGKRELNEARAFSHFVEKELGAWREKAERLQQEVNEIVFKHVNLLDVEKEEKRKLRLDFERAEIEKKFLEAECKVKKEGFEEADKKQRRLFKEKEELVLQLFEKDRKLAVFENKAKYDKEVN